MGTCRVPVGIVTCLTMQGRLKENSDFWLNELEPSSFVADIVTKDYSLPFIMLPGLKH